MVFPSRVTRHFYRIFCLSFSVRNGASSESPALQQCGKEGHRICRRVVRGRHTGGDALVARARIVEIVGCIRVKFERYVGVLGKVLVDEMLPFLRLPTRERVFGT